MFLHCCLWCGEPGWIAIGLRDEEFLVPKWIPICPFTMYHSIYQSCNTSIPSAIMLKYFQSSLVWSVMKWTPWVPIRYSGSPEELFSSLTITEKHHSITGTITRFQRPLGWIKASLTKLLGDDPSIHQLKCYWATPTAQRLQVYRNSPFKPAGCAHCHVRCVDGVKHGYISLADVSVLLAGKIRIIHVLFVT